jgi:hypothetical protein
VKRVFDKLNNSHANYFIDGTISTLDSTNKVKLKDISIGQSALYFLPE